MADTSLVNNKTGLMLWKTSNMWQSLLRRSLRDFSLTLNEFIILETLYNLSNFKLNVNQVYISKSSGVDVSVVSTILKLLKKKSLIIRKIDKDSRNHIIDLTNDAYTLLEKILPEVNIIEKNFFSKLGKEETNFCNSLRLVLGRRIKVKAERAK